MYNFTLLFKFEWIFLSQCNEGYIQSSRFIHAVSIFVNTDRYIMFMLIVWDGRKGGGEGRIVQSLIEYEHVYFRCQ